ncbi:MAG: type II toxin-antitoxin system prevent-host-death family antitoxin [Gammaproteobacteria bacterium]|nr:type II toxin-antitoxin system prevent-host-death family antitoxin [Gammaproteobacteria bacterium]
MNKIGAFEAKTHLSALLDKVNHGEEFIITRRGKAIARLIPAEKANRAEVYHIIDELISLRKDVTLNGENWKDLRDEGRR